MQFNQCLNTSIEKQQEFFKKLRGISMMAYQISCDIEELEDLKTEIFQGIEKSKPANLLLEQVINLEEQLQNIYFSTHDIETNSSFFEESVAENLGYQIALNGEWKK